MEHDGARRGVVVDGQPLSAAGAGDQLHHAQGFPAVRLPEAELDARSIRAIEQIARRRAARHGNILPSS